MDLESARREYMLLRDGGIDGTGSAQKRGFAFERIIKNVLGLSNLQPRASFKTQGEQIDGSFLYSGRVYLLEAKWTQSPLPASTLYAFKGKVDGKLVGTIGVYISMAGYSEEAIDALVAGKALNLILFDQSDWELGLDSGFCFTKVLEAKLRAAADEGTPFYRIPCKDSTATISDASDVTVVTEGALDNVLIAEALKRARPEIFARVPVSIAGGARNVLAVAKTVLDSGISRKVIAIVDDDEAGRETAKEAAQYENVHVLLADHYLDQSLLHETIAERFGTYASYRLLPYNERLAFVRQAVPTLSVASLRSNPTIMSLINEIGT